MPKTSVLHARIETDLKNIAENIFEQLGLTASDAIKLFYKQVELQGGLPFEIKVPPKVFAEQKLFEEIERGKKSAQEQGFLNLADSKKAILG